MSQNERLIVLELLKEGKISMDEAEKLLTALSRQTGERRKSEPRQRIEEAFQRVEREFRAIDLSGFEKKLSGFFEVMRSRFADMAAETDDADEAAEPKDAARKNGEDGYKAVKGAAVHIAQKGGAARLYPAENDRLRVSGANAKVETSPDGKRIEVEGSAGPLSVAVPNGLSRVFIDASGAPIEAEGVAPKEFTARLVGGGMRLKRIGGTIRLSVVGGGLFLEEPLSDDIEAETNGGSLRARLGDVKSGRCQLSASGGSVEAELGAGSDFELEYNVEGGAFESQWSAESIGENRLRVGEGAAKLVISTHGGSVALNKSSDSSQGAEE